MSLCRTSPIWDIHGNRWDSFLGLYRYAEKYSNVPDYTNMSPRFIKAATYYEYRQSECIKTKGEREEIRWQQKHSKLRQGLKTS